jgi:hypothetical protein
VTNESGLPSEVTALLRRALPSMVHIESLLLLARVAPQPASRLDMAAELRSSPALVAAALADLEAAGLVAAVPGSEQQEYRFAATDAATVQSVAALRDVYERKPVTLIRVMYERPAEPPVSPSVQAFADAFRVRRPEDK